MEVRRRWTDAGQVCIDVREDSRLPLEYRLYQNYPNPFNPTTEIRYQTSDVGRVVLNVYDILGRKVTTLVDEIQSPGLRSGTFNATTLPSGVYFYRLTARSFVETKRMMLLK